MKVTSNYQPRNILSGYDLTLKEREEFDYIDWKEVEAGNSSPEFMRYKGTTYDLGEFGYVHAQLALELFPKRWDGFQADTYFSGLLVKYCNGYDSIIVGRYCT